MRSDQKLEIAIAGRTEARVCCIVTTHNSCSEQRPQQQRRARRYHTEFKLSVADVAALSSSSLTVFAFGVAAATSDDSSDFWTSRGSLVSTLFSPVERGVHYYRLHSTALNLTHSLSVQPIGHYSRALGNHSISHYEQSEARPN